MKSILVQATVKQMSLMPGTIIYNDLCKDNELVKEPFVPMPDWSLKSYWIPEQQPGETDSSSSFQSDEPCPECKC